MRVIPAGCRVAGLTWIIRTVLTGFSQLRGQNVQWIPDGHCQRDN